MLNRIDPAVWNQASAALNDLLALDRAARKARLSEIGRAEPKLAPVLTELLRLHDDAEATDFLGTSVLGPRKKDHERAPSLVGTRIGAYELQRLVGRGGTGHVWLARRHDGRFEQQVAIKLLDRATAFSPEALHRFEREGQLLGQLQHPGVARLLDAGVANIGDAPQPYLVLDYVDGVPIDVWCKRQRASPRVIIRLMLRVLDAVKHAHAHLVVHRDLKPSNIVVTADGSPRLLDFGVAQLLQPEKRADTGDVTQHIVPLTLSYAAPEQINGELVATAADTYAIGVMLYELLTGQHPFGDAPTSIALIDAVLKREPEQASAFAAKHAPDNVAFLRGDLDLVLAKALHKRPEHRYESAAQLASDLRSVLQHQPVSARTPATWYLARLFVRRHRATVIGAAAASVAIVSLALVAGSQARRATQERDVALARLEQASALDDLLVGLLNDLRAVERPLSATEITQRAEALIRRNHARDLHTQAQLLLTLANYHHNRADYAEAQRVSNIALERAERSRDTDSLARARCTQGLMLQQSGTSSEGLQLVHAALRELPAEPRWNDARAACLQRLSEIHALSGNLAASLTAAHAAEAFLPTGASNGNPKAMTWSILAQAGEKSGPVLVGADAASNPYEGDTRDTSELPILCISKQALQPFAGYGPAGSGTLQSNGYSRTSGGALLNSWSGARVFWSSPQSSRTIRSRQTANLICAQEALAHGLTGTYRMAEFHDGDQKAGWAGWSYWADASEAFSKAKAIPLEIGKQRFWVAIDRQRANLWD